MEFPLILACSDCGKEMGADASGTNLVCESCRREARIIELCQYRPETLTEAEHLELAELRRGPYGGVVVGPEDIPTFHLAYKGGGGRGAYCGHKAFVPVPVTGITWTDPRLCFDCLVKYREQRRVAGVDCSLYVVRVPD